MAIALFPFSEGETIGGNLGRYADFIGLKTTLPLRRRLFGYACKPDTRLPSGLNHLAEETQDYWNMDAYEIIRCHTEFNYATATVAESQRREMLSDMLTQPTERCLRRSVCGWTGEHVTRFRYCDECLSEWGSKSVPYHWMVDHQLPGVYFCCLHSRMLKVATREDSKNLTDLTVLAVKGCDDKQILSGISPSEGRAIEDVAKRSARYRAMSDHVPVATIYRDLLRDAGFTWPNERVDGRSFLSALLSYFGREYWNISGLNWQKMTTWLRDIADPRGGSEPFHPLMFIAAESLLTSRCASPGSFVPEMQKMAIDRENRLRGFRQDAVDPNLSDLQCTGTLHRNSDFWTKCTREGEGWKLVCSCGLSYLTSSVLQVGRVQLTVVALGARYQSHLRRMLVNGVTIEVASRKLHIPEATLSRWARSIGCEKRMALSSAEIQHLRERWCSLVQHSRADKRITSASRADSKLYRTLRRYDRDWFAAFNFANRTRSKRRRASEP